MQTALQLGQRQFPFQQILQYLITSPFLTQYLRLVIIEETLVNWQQSPEYQSIWAKTDPSESAYSLGSRDPLPENSSQVESNTNSLSNEELPTLEKYQQVHWGHRVSSHFLARKGQLDRAIFSAIQVDHPGMAQEIYLRIKDRRQSFDKLARLYSQGTAATLGGVTGPVEIDRLHPHIAYHLIGLEPGELSPLFQIDNFYVFIRLEQRLPARFDEEMKGQLMTELFEQWLQTEVTSRISSLQMTELTTDEQLAQAAELNRQPLSPTSAEIDRSRHELAQSEMEVIDPNQPSKPDLDRPSMTIESSTSFFPPAIENLSPTESSENLDLIGSSFFAPQSTPTQIIDRHKHHRRQVLVQQIVAFFLFFGLFLGGGLGTVYLLNFLAGTDGVQAGRK
jgi:PPIC-type PPIASE domain